MQASKITILVGSGNGDPIRKVAPGYTSKPGTTIDVLELPYDQTFQKLQIALIAKDRRLRHRVTGRPVDPPVRGRTIPGQPGRHVRQSRDESEPGFSAAAVRSGRL